MKEKLLHIYLADHLAVAIGTHAVAKRCLQSNRDSPLGNYLAEGLIPELEEDRAALENVMDAVGAPKASYKQLTARAAAQVGRLKLNGRALTYSPLSRLEELEGLCLGVEGKVLLWTSLSSTPRAQRLGVDTNRLIERARAQRSHLEEHRLRAVEAAL
jgi:hypothetical protein